jgi:hypothetical protein
MFGVNINDYEVRVCTEHAAFSRWKDEEEVVTKYLDETSAHDV